MSDSIQRASVLFLIAGLACSACGHRASGSGRDAAAAPAARDASVAIDSSLPATDAAPEPDDAGAIAPDAAEAAGEDAASLTAVDAGAAPDAGDLPDASAVEVPDASPPAPVDAGAPEPADASAPLPPCAIDPPGDAALPGPLPVYAGTCPGIASYPADNHIISSGNDRVFKLVVPSSVQPGERLPLVFTWYWLWGTTDDLVSTLDLQAAVEEQRFIAVVPEDKGDLLFKWPFTIADSDDRLNEEIQFFDDMLACVAPLYPEINPGCVATVGISAGALFTDQLAPRRGDRLASFSSISGGVGTTARGWDGGPRAMPGIVLWGGPNDDFKGLFDFTKASGNLEDELTGGGNFFIECIHNCGHAVPPFDVAPGSTLFAPVWEFVRWHPYWLAPGDSPWKAEGLPRPLFPDWCGIGKGSATPRTDPSGC